MKTGLLETRPIFVRKQKRTKGHVFVVMLAYIIIHELKKLWNDLDVKIQEGINELVMINTVEVQINDVSCHQIPEPRELGEKLLDACGVSLPKVLPCGSIKIATKKKLGKQRKRR